MFCAVYRLRYLGNLITPDEPRYMAGTHGVLSYLPDRHLEMRATLYRIEDEAEIMFLSRARVVKAGHGGILFGGVDLVYRGVKSKGEAYRQSWWCVPMTRVTVTAESQADPIEGALT